MELTPKIYLLAISIQISIKNQVSKVRLFSLWFPSVINHFSYI